MTSFYDQGAFTALLHLKLAKDDPPVAGHPWVRAKFLRDAEGFTKGEEVVVRKSRSGGTRILNPHQRTLVVADKHLDKWVEHHKVDGKHVPHDDQPGMDKALRSAFAAGWKANPGVKQASTLSRTLIGAGVGGALGAGVGAFTGQSADPDDPLSTGTRGRNALIGGGIGAVLGGGAGFMADKGSVRPTSPITSPPKGPSALQLGAARSQSYENLGGASMHDPSALSGAATGMGNLDHHVEQANAAATRAAFPKTRELPLIPVAPGNRGYFSPPATLIEGDERLQSMADRLSVGHKLGAAYAAEKLALMPSQLQHALVGAGIGGTLGAGVAALTGTSENRQRNMMMGGLGGMALGGTAGLLARPTFGDHVMSQPRQLMDANPITHAPPSGAPFAKHVLNKPDGLIGRARAAMNQPQVPVSYHESYDALLKARALRDVYEGAL